MDGLGQCSEKNSRHCSVATYNTIGWAIRYRAEMQSSSVAVVATGFHPLTYEKLQGLIDNTRIAFRLAGIARTARVVVAMRDGPQTALAIVAVACSAVSIPVNPRQTPSEIERCFSYLRPDAVLLAKNVDFAARRVAEAQDITIIEMTHATDGTLGFSIDPPNSENFANFDVSDEPDADELAFILQTSGTVAEPKLIPISHRIVLAAAERDQLCYVLTPDDRCLSVTPIWYAYGSFYLSSHPC